MRKTYKHFILILFFSIISSSNIYSLKYLMGWGRNNYGQLGDGTTTNYSTPHFIWTDTNWINLATGSAHTLAIKSNGTLWAWGLNNNGQLGDNTFINRYTPVQIGTDSNWVYIAAGVSFSLAIKSDGTLWAWGNNYNFTLGNGTQIDSNVPVIVNIIDDIWIYCTCNIISAFGISGNGFLWAWGCNNDGILDRGQINDILPYPIVISDNNYIKVSGFGDHTLAIQSDSSLWAWGYNYNGQLGDGTNIQRLYPVVIDDTSHNWKEIYAEGNSSLALKSNGTRWAWGRNNLGQHGDGTTTNKYFPTQIGNDTNWTQLSGYGSNFFGIKSNGTLWAWGQNNEYGILGDGTTLQRNSPVQIGSSYHWKQVAVGSYHALAICEAFPPVLNINNISNIALISVTIGSTISKTWGFNATSRGFCWSTSPNPTINDFHTTETGNFGTGSFSATIGPLLPNTTYHVRAYATNIAGTGYSNDTTFTTLPGQAIILQPGWNMKSSYINPENNVFSVLMQCLSPNLLVAKNGAGLLYIPEWGINQIPSWNYQQGYLFYMNATDTLLIPGQPVVPEETPIYLNPGWRIISYLRQTSMPVTTALASINGNFLLVKNNEGNLYIPSWGINMLGNMVPGEGYFIYVTQPCVLVYPGE